jgi:hypothetical protein
MAALALCLSLAALLHFLIRAPRRDNEDETFIYAQPTAAFCSLVRTALGVLSAAPRHGMADLGTYIF